VNSLVIVEIQYANIPINKALWPTEMQLNDINETEDDWALAEQRELNQRCMNGILDTWTLLRCRKKYGELFDRSLTTLRRWARARRIYGTDAGFWGGITLALCLVYTLQKCVKLQKIPVVPQGYMDYYPVVIKTFFDLFSKFSWSSEQVHLRPDFQGIRHPEQLMQIFTPSDPPVNTTARVETGQLRIIGQELTRANELLNNAVPETIESILCDETVPTDIPSWTISISVLENDDASYFQAIGWIRRRAVATIRNIPHEETFIRPFPITSREIDGGREQVFVIYVYNGPNIAVGELMKKLHTYIETLQQEAPSDVTVTLDFNECGR